MTIQSILKSVAREGVSLIEVQFTDLLGEIKSVSIRVELLEEALKEGVWFDGSSVKGFRKIFESDLLLKPDLSTFRVLPWWDDEYGKVARVLCDIYTPDGVPFESDPRGVLKRILKKLADKGYRYNVGPELEFFLFPIDDQGEVVFNSVHNNAYFELSKDHIYNVKKEMIAALQKMGIQVETSHYEVADKQHEIDFRYGEVLVTADNAVTFKYVVKMIAAKHKLHASFMPKPTFGLNGSGMHCHQSLADEKTGKNIFSDRKGGLSSEALQFMAGLLKYIREFTVIVAPTVNSYKRLTPGYEAPVYACWARSNRSALIRVPRIIKGKEAATRFELRCPDPSANPYLASAAMLMAGMRGMEEKLVCPEAIEDNLFEYTLDEIKGKGIVTLPSSLEESLKEAEAGSLVRNLLGDDLFLKFVELKYKEWDDYRTWVSDWERQMYKNV